MKIDFRAKDFPSKLEDNEPDEKGYKI